MPHCKTPRDNLSGQYLNYCVLPQSNKTSFESDSTSGISDE